MAKRKSGTNSLDIYLNAIPLGILEFEARKNLVFQYKEEWLTRPQAFPISRSLPLREEEYEGEKVFAYFDNLLPDNVSIRQRIAARMRAVSDQVFDLLVVVGRDCVGALQFTRSTEPAPILEPPKGVPMSNHEIATKLKDLRITPLAASQEEDFRLSIAGAQDKTAFLYLEGQWNMPSGATPTTHIFKPQIGELRPGLSFSDSVENEWLCSRIVSAFGIETANCSIEIFEDVKVLVVERFDRFQHDDKIIRLPQEDLCQAMGIPNFGKYEAEGGPGILQIMDVLNESSDRERDRYNFMKAQVVFLLLAAIDGHAKNFSIAWSSGTSGFALTPLYDVLSAQPLIDAGKYDVHKLKMAMAVGDKRHYKVAEIYRRHFLQTARLCKFGTDQMEQLIDETLNQIPDVINVVRAELTSNFPKKIAESIFNGMTARAAQLAP